MSSKKNFSDDYFEDIDIALSKLSNVKNKNNLNRKQKRYASNHGGFEPEHIKTKQSKLREQKRNFNNFVGRKCK